MQINDKLKSLRNERKSGRIGQRHAEHAEDIEESISFSDHLTQQVSTHQAVPLRVELGRMQEALSKAGDELERNPTLGNLEVFRALLASIVKKVTQQGFAVDNLGPGWQAQDRHQIIRTLDEEATHLLDLVLQEQKDRVAITRRVVQIKGLVVDLLS